MSESKTAKKAILDKFRQILVFLYQRRPKKMSENAERPAKSGRGSGQKERPTTSCVSSRPRSGQKERPTTSSVRSQPRIGSEGAADRLERAFPAAIRLEGAADRLERAFPAAEQVVGISRTGSPAR